MVSANSARLFRVLERCSWFYYKNLTCFCGVMGRQWNAGLDLEAERKKIRKYVNYSKMWWQLSVITTQSMSLFCRTAFQTAKTNLFHYTAMISTFILAVDSALKTHTIPPKLSRGHHFRTCHFIQPKTGSLAPACELIRAREHTHTRPLWLCGVWSEGFEEGAEPLHNQNHLSHSLWTSDTHTHTHTRTYSLTSAFLLKQIYTHTICVV